MSERKRFDARLNVFVSAELHHKLEQIRDQRGPKVTIPDIIREAVRQYVDNEEDIIGSRRHFQRSLRDTVEVTRLQLMWNQLVLLGFIWQGITPVINPTTQQPQPFKETFERSLQFADKQWKSLFSQMDHGFEKTLPIELEERLKKELQKEIQKDMQKDAHKENQK